MTDFRAQKNARALQIALIQATPDCPGRIYAAPLGQQGHGGQQVPHPPLGHIGKQAVQQGPDGEGRSDHEQGRDGAPEFAIGRRPLRAIEPVFEPARQRRHGGHGRADDPANPRQSRNQGVADHGK